MTSVREKKDSNVIQFPLQRKGVEFKWDAQGFYTPKEASRIARVHKSTVTKWDKKGIVVPTLEWVDEDDRRVLGYSFGALILLRLIRMLRNESFTLRKAVGAVHHLVDVFGSPSENWANVRIFSDGHDLWVDHSDDWEVTAATRHGQKAFHELFGPEFALLRQRADALLIPSKFSKSLEMNPSVRNGHPIIRKTRIETNTIRALRKEGLSYSQIREYYPFLSPKQISQSDKFEQYLDVESIAA